MKVIIAGSRTINDPNLLRFAVGEFQATHGSITEIISGGALGVDLLGIALARLLNIPLKVMKADWQTFGKSAGMRRNEEMGTYADAVIALWDGNSRGTKHMIEFMEKQEKLVFVKSPVAAQRFPLFA